MIKKILIPLITIVILASCGISEDKYQDIEGVAFKTELEYYAEGTQRLMAHLENNTEGVLTYGWAWRLEMFDESKKTWAVHSNNPFVDFAQPGFAIFPDTRINLTYDIDLYDENIKEGRYRVVQGFHRWEGRESVMGNRINKEYSIAAEFKVTSDMSLIRTSELDFDDIENSKEIEIRTTNWETGGAHDFPVRMYKNKFTFDTTIVISGTEYYQIAEGTGEWGVLRYSYLLADGDSTYIIYSYSRERDNGKSYSHIGVFDLNLKKEIYLSDAFDEGYDIALSERGETVFAVFSGRYFESQGGGRGDIYSTRDIGHFRYENGTFRLELEK
jgi:hypothetical protein